MASPKVIIAGGSLGGLTAALTLQDAGCEVVVYERSRAPLEGSGAGIVLHPATVRYPLRRGLADISTLGTAARRLRYLARDGSVEHEQPCSYRFASYAFLHGLLLDAFGRERYHLGTEVVGFEQDAAGVDVKLEGGGDDRGDLLVCADGIRSSARRTLLPDVRPRYAGYVAWRGTVGEAELEPATFALVRDAIAYHVLPHSHILAYPIPALDGALTAGARLTNWVWYRNVAAGAALDDLLTDRHGNRRDLSLPPGSVADRYVTAIRDAAGAELPAPMAEMVRRAAEPFVQVVFDIEVPRMAFGRVCLIGDAAFALRPHAAAGTAKAAEDAWTLAAAVSAGGDDLPGALQRWESRQLALGRRALERTRAAGDRSQFEGTWRTGDPLPFGLHETGDSALPTD
jgi:2,6-dihydroxypyridine 3-monooxygenase